MATKKATESQMVDISYEMQPEMSIKDYTNTYYKEYSLYVLQQRAIPNYIDGFKVVHRKLICAALDIAKNKKIKVAELGSSLSSYEYLHGEVSAQDALVGMSADWKNNIPLFTGHGNFGSRLIQEAAASRYIYVTLSEQFNDIYSDFEVCVSRLDNPEPITYLPIIPWSLINGISGLAVGFACNILPRDWKTVKQACLEYAQKGKIKTSIDVKYPKFLGEVQKVGDNKWTTLGVVNKVKRGRKTVYHISELPLGYDREKYFNLLVKLKNTNKITDFDDDCNKEGFNFYVYASDDEMKAIDIEPIKFFGLIKSETENLTTIDENGNLKIFQNPEELVKSFCDYRILKCGESLQFTINKTKNKLIELEVKRLYISLVLDGKLILNEHTRKSLLTYVLGLATINNEIADRIISIPSYSFTKDNILDLDSQIAKVKAEISKLESSNGKDIFIEKLKKLNLD